MKDPGWQLHMGGRAAFCSCPPVRHMHAACRRAGGGHLGGGGGGLGGRGGRGGGGQGGLGREGRRCGGCALGRGGLGRGAGGGGGSTPPAIESRLCHCDQVTLVVGRGAACGLATDPSAHARTCPPALPHHASSSSRAASRIIRVCAQTTGFRAGPRPGNVASCSALRTAGRTCARRIPCVDAFLL